MIKFDNLPHAGQALTPFMVVKDAAAMFEFYKKALGAEVLHVSRVPDTDIVMHATVQIGGSIFFVNDEFPQSHSVAPVTAGSTSSSIHIQVSEGLDELFDQAVAAGAQPTMKPEDMFWGSRFAMFVDPSGHRWSIGMPIENAPEMDVEELKTSLGVG